MIKRRNALETGRFIFLRQQNVNNFRYQTNRICFQFVLAMIDKNGNTMSYLLSGMFVGVVPSVIFFFVRTKMPLAWAVCLMVSVSLFAGAVIFRGREVAAELQRRFHM